MNINFSNLLKIILTLTNNNFIIATFFFFPQLFHQSFHLYNFLAFISFCYAAKIQKILYLENY